MSDLIKWRYVADRVGEHLIYYPNSLNTLAELRAFLINKPLPESVNPTMHVYVRNLIIALSHLVPGHNLDVSGYMWSGQYTFLNWTRNSAIDLVDDFVAYIDACTKSVATAIDDNNTSR